MCYYPTILFPVLPCLLSARVVVRVWCAVSEAGSKLQASCRAVPVPRCRLIFSALPVVVPPLSTRRHDHRTRRTRRELQRGHHGRGCREPLRHLRYERRAEATNGWQRQTQK